jgi:hypothetical protein
MYEVIIDLGDCLYDSRFPNSLGAVYAPGPGVSCLAYDLNLFNFGAGLIMLVPWLIVPDRTNFPLMLSEGLYTPGPGVSVLLLSSNLLLLGDQFAAFEFDIVESAYFPYLLISIP